MNAGRALQNENRCRVRRDREKRFHHAGDWGKTRPAAMNRQHGPKNKRLGSKQRSLHDKTMENTPRYGIHLAATSVKHFYDVARCYSFLLAN